MSSYSLRQQQLKNWLKEQKKDAFLITDLKNVQWITGFTGSFGMYWQGRNNGVLITDKRYALSAEEVVKKAGISFCLYDGSFKDRFADIQRGILCVENTLTLARFEQIKTWFENMETDPQSTIVERFRRVKDEQEIEYMKKAQAHVDVVLFPFLKKQIQKGITEEALTYKLKQVLESEGQYGLSFDPIVAFGANAAIPHHHPGQTKLRENECILIDCGVTYKGYCSDMTRNAYFGTVSEEYKKAYDILLTIQNDVCAKCIAGTDIDSLDRYVREKLGQDALLFTHSLGHGVGLDIHEAPGISEKSSGVLVEKEVITIEPGIYKDGVFGIRIEDIGVVRKDHFEIYSTTSKELLIVV